MVGPSAPSKAGRLPGFARVVADIIVPHLCQGCRRFVTREDTLCATCWRDVKFISAPLCDRLGIPLPYDTGGPQVSAQSLAQPPDFDRARVAVHYMKPASDMIRRFKYHDQPEPRRLLARWLAVAGRELLVDAHSIVPVPLNRLRLLSRRFNQSAELAREVSVLTGVPYAPDVLVRITNTRQQVGLTEAQRASNVRGAFKVPEGEREAVAGRRIVLVDDVITTGATVNACARALRRAGAARIDVLAVAMTTDYARVHGDEA